MGAWSASATTFPDTKRISLDVPSGTVLDLMNAVLRAHGERVWELRPADPEVTAATGLRQTLMFSTFQGGGGTGTEADPFQGIAEADKAAAMNPEFGFDAFALTADWTEELNAAQDSLVEEPGGERELARLVDRLTVKLGPNRVRRPKQHKSHLPERASGW